MWRSRGGRDDEEQSEEIASSFASSQSRSVDSSNDWEPQYEKRSPREEQDDSEGDSYEDEDFEHYSDEFESEEEEEKEEMEEEEEEEEGRRNEPATQRKWEVGDRVEAYWEEERTWFGGVVGRIDRTQCFVQYTDGEQQWEESGSLRRAPPLHAQGAAQLQQLRSNGRDGSRSPLVGRRVFVYWHDERNWFDGRIDEEARADGASCIHVNYDDGDNQWLPSAAFGDVLVLPRTSTVESAIFEPTNGTTGRVLTPRPYTTVVKSHFEPIRVARPYSTTVANHLGSVVTPRSWNGTLYYHPLYYHPRVVAQLDCVAHHTASNRDTCSRECEVQTDLSDTSERPPQSSSLPQPSTASA